jgi:hypothetical protein
MNEHNLMIYRFRYRLAVEEIETFIRLKQLQPA